MSKDNVVGFVGLGTMGGRMAANVQRAGFKLVVHDLHRQAASHHLNAGAVWADSPCALAREDQSTRHVFRQVRSRPEQIAGLAVLPELRHDKQAAPQLRLQRQENDARSW